MKAEQERIVEAGPIPWSIVRATQFHNYLAGMFAGSARWGVLALTLMQVQTVDVGEVAHTIADIAEAGSQRQRINIAGPEINDARDLARLWREATGKKWLLPLPIPGKAGRALRDGATTTASPDLTGTITFASG